MEKLTISVEEVGEILGVGRNSAYTLVHQPGFPAIRLGKRIVVPIESLRIWLAENSIKGITLIPYKSYSVGKPKKKKKK